MKKFIIPCILLISCNTEPTAEQLKEMQQKDSIRHRIATNQHKIDSINKELNELDSGK